MSLLRDYLEKTTPQARQGQDAQVPPMLRQDTKTSRGRVRRIMPVLVIFLVVLGFSGYIFKASFPELTAQPQPMPSNPEKTLAVSTVKNINTSSTPEYIKTSPVKITPADQKPVIAKQVTQPVTVEPPEPVKPSVKQPVLMAQIKAPKPPMAETLPEPSKALQQIQAAMEANKPEKREAPETVVPNTYRKPSVPGPEDYFNLGLAAQKRDDVIQAVGYYKKTLTLKPDHSRALLNLSTVYIKTGNHSKAMAILKKLHTQEPENVDAMVNLGILFLDKNNHDRAKSLFEKALDLRENNTTALFNLAYVNQMQTHLEQAKKLYTRVSSIDRDHTSAFLATASILENQKKFSQAQQCYVAALKTTEVKASKPLRLKIETRINLLQQMKAGSEHQIINAEETHD
ncbi:tetratricopeptide repeat protein [Desulfobacula sp.]|uniref:tetratricopeptide repeat protein n=1 Tax=Desulfobacula sp. TaxID=2593537 RepID=UPI00260C58B4|nr:tetratricopeptide repeat protein [Desulfobacula sp.]